MTKRHTVIDSSLGELPLVADGDALTGVYFRHHWHPPTVDALGRLVDPADVDLFHLADDYLLFFFFFSTFRPLRSSATRASGGSGNCWRTSATATPPPTASWPPNWRRHHRIRSRPGRRAQSAQHRGALPSGCRKGRALTGYAGGLKRKRFLLDLEEPVPAAAGRLF